MTVRPTSRAFSLVELLVVLAIVGLLATMIVPSIGSVLQANQLTTAGTQITQLLSAARQTALARNRRVEVRIYSFRRANPPEKQATFHALQSFVVEPDGRRVPLSRVLKLPGSIVLNETSALSPLIADLPDKSDWMSPQDPQIPIPEAGTTYTAKAMEFRPDGGTSLAATGQWFLTATGGTNDPRTATPPANFVTVQIDPVAGGVRLYRP